MYSGRSFGFVRSSIFLMSYCHLFWLSIGCNLLVLNVNNMFWYCILHSFVHSVNYIVPKFQFTSRLCLTNQSYPKNMTMLFKSVTVTSMCSLYSLISSSSGTNYITSPFLVLSVLKNSNDLFIGSVLILSFFTSCLSIPVWIQPESTSTFNHNYFLFDVLIYMCIFNSLSLLSHQFGIIYQFLELLYTEVCCTMAKKTGSKSCMRVLAIYNKVTLLFRVVWEQEFTTISW